MKQQTAVEYLINEISVILGPLKTKPIQDLLMVDAINKAKEMEKEQHRRTYVDSTSQFENEAYMPHVKPF